MNNNLTIGIQIISYKEDARKHVVWELSSFISIF